MHVQLASPIGWNPGGSSSSLWNLLDSLETEPQQFTSAQRTSLASLLSQDYKALGITNPTGAQVETQLYDEATQSTPQDGAQLAGWLEEDPTSHNDLEQILLGILETPGQGLSVNQRYLWVNMLSPTSRTCRARKPMSPRRLSPSPTSRTPSSPAARPRSNLHS